MRTKIKVSELPDLQVLKVCLELWTWVVDHPDYEKGGWPGWTKYDYCENYCPCCEKSGLILHTSYKIALRPRCEVCLLKDKFKVGKCTGRQEFFYCENYSGSPWEHFRLAYTRRTKKKWAQKMVDITNEAIKELKGD